MKKILTFFLVLVFGASLAYAQQNDDTLSYDIFLQKNLSIGKAIIKKDTERIYTTYRIFYHYDMAKEEAIFSVFGQKIDLQTKDRDSEKVITHDFLLQNLYEIRLNEKKYLLLKGGTGSATGSFVNYGMFFLIDVSSPKQPKIYYYRSWYGVVEHIGDFDQDGNLDIIIFDYDRDCRKIEEFICDCFIGRVYQIEKDILQKMKSMELWIKVQRWTAKTSWQANWWVVQRKWFF